MRRQEAQRLTHEAEQILLDAGFTKVRADHFGPWWRVRGDAPSGQEHTGTTHEQADPQDPCDLARRIVVLARGERPAPVFEEIPEAPPTEEPTFPDEVPLAPDDQQIEVELAGEAGENFAHETHGETGEEAEAASGVGEQLADSGGRSDPEEDDVLAAGPDGAAAVSERADTGSDEWGRGVDELPIDADFTTLEIPEEPPVEEFGAELLDDYPATAPPLLEGAETSEPPPETSGPIAYAASDLDALVREKLGRLSQIARELKALLQDGWTTEEFASKQSYVVGNTDAFGAFIGDQAIYDRFVEMSNLQGAQRRVEIYRELLEAELELIGQHRDYAGAVAFDPERLRDEQWMFGGFDALAGES